MPSADVAPHGNEVLPQSLTSQPPRVPLARTLALVERGGAGVVAGLAAPRPGRRRAGRAVNPPFS